MKRATKGPGRGRDEATQGDLVSRNETIEQMEKRQAAATPDAHPEVLAHWRAISELDQ